ncbi:Uncharacterised protein [uncultured archaeon]|nr:Uncharacterised protein [uncultured archaeon]
MSQVFLNTTQILPHDFQLEIVKAFLTIIVLFVTIFVSWKFGQVQWNIYQKKRETDIDILQKFYLLYGEFKEVSKMWRVIKEKSSES